jgi:transposase
VPGPTACACCGSTRLSKLGEDITETLEVIPRQWKVIQHVREKFTCRACEKISQAPAPFHVIARGRAGPSLLAMILYAKFALHQPLNRQSEAYACEGVDLPLSTLADDVGACAAVLTPLAELIGAQVFAAARIHGDDTPVPLLAKGKTVQARLWTYVRDDRPFGGPDPPAAVYFFSRDRSGERATGGGVICVKTTVGNDLAPKAEGRAPKPLLCPSSVQERLAIRALDFGGPALLDQGDDLLGQRHIIEFLGHFAALFIGPAEELQGSAAAAGSSGVLGMRMKVAPEIGHDLAPGSSVRI